MITTLIGKTFLKAYNEKYMRQYTAKEFFEKEYYELFFKHNKYMQWVTNSPFVQMKTGQKPDKLSVAERQEKLHSLFAKVETETPDASFAIGFPASENKEYASTSGLVSDVVIATDEDDVYLSWIGSGLGIGVAGGLNLLINDVEITLQTYEGWKSYRKYLNDPTLDKLRGNQINSWNGQWLTYRLGSSYDVDFDFGTLTDQGVFKVENSMAEVNTVNWSNLFFSLSNLYPNATLNTYIYSFGQTNKTVGFIPMYLKSGHKLKEVHKALFHTNAPFKQKDFQSLFGMHIKRACEIGNIGLHALRPVNLKKYMEEDKNLSFKKEEETIIYQSYKTWLIAMLSKNKEEITDYTSEIAHVLFAFRKAGTKTDRINLIKNDLLGAKSKKAFIEGLTAVLKDIEMADMTIIKQLKDDVHLMTNEEFGYFNTLLKFDYTFVEKQS